jgi:hypothetical protein
MRRPTPSPTGSKFTVRGQVYVQSGAFFHPMSNDREVRILELNTTCPDCSATFQATASMRQIKTRQLVRRCPECRKIHAGPVAIVAPVARNAAKKKTTGRKARRASPRLSTREFEPSDRITLIEVRPADIYPGETPAAALQRALAQALDGPAESQEDLVQHQYRDTLGMLD